MATDEPQPDSRRDRIDVLREFGPMIEDQRAAWPQHLRGRLEESPAIRFKIRGRLRIDHVQTRLGQPASLKRPKRRRSHIGMLHNTGGQLVVPRGKIREMQLDGIAQIVGVPPSEAGDVARYTFVAPAPKTCPARADLEEAKSPVLSDRIVAERRQIGPDHLGQSGRSSARGPGAGPREGEQRPADRPSFLVHGAQISEGVSPGGHRHVGPKPLRL